MSDTHDKHGYPLHTPGPWHAQCDPCHYDTLSEIRGGSTERRNNLPQQLMVSVGGWASWQEQEANARLIAAAPDMLEALRFLRDNYDVADVVDPIITKATGETK